MDEGANDDFDVAFDQLPDAVQTTANGAIGSGTVTGVDRDTKKDGTVQD